MDKVIINFLYKYLCILKAVSEGWIVSYIGGNKFIFKSKKRSNINAVLRKYINTLPSILTIL